MVALELGSSLSERHGGSDPRGIAEKVRPRASAHLPFHNARDTCLAWASLGNLDQHHVQLWAEPFGLIGSGPKRCSHVLEPKQAWMLGAVQKSW